MLGDVDLGLTYPGVSEVVSADLAILDPPTLVAGTIKAASASTGIRRSISPVLITQPQVPNFRRINSVKGMLAGFPAEIAGALAGLAAGLPAGLPAQVATGV